MPDQLITIPGYEKPIVFPESMSPEQINAAAAKLYQAKNPDRPPVDSSRSWVDTAVDWLPTAGAMAGSLAGGIGGTAFGMGVGGVPGAAGGAFVGGAAGEGAKQTINALRGKGTSTPTAVAGDMLKEGATQGAMDLAGGALGTLASKAAPRLMQSALKPTKAVLSEYKTTAPKLVQTLLDEGVNVTTNGLAKLQTLLDATNQEIKSVLLARDSAVQRIAPGANRVIDKTNVAARTLSTAGKLAQQTNPTRDLKALAKTVEEFQNHPVYPGKLTLPEAQAMKIGTYQQIGRKYGEVSSAAIETQKALARGLKEEIANEVPQVATLNQRDAELMAALDAVGHRAALSGNKDPIGFAWVTHNPTTFLAAMFDRSAAVKSMLARGLYTQAANIARVSPQLVRAAVATLATHPDDTTAPDGGPPPE